LLDNSTRLVAGRWFVWLHERPVSSIRAARPERSLAVADGDGAPGTWKSLPQFDPKESDKGE
jgi:hypothetical protein